MQLKHCLMKQKEVGGNSVMGEVISKPKGSVLGTFDGKACDSNVFNNNDMHLSRQLFENVLASQEYRDGIERGHYIGFLGHPEDPGCQDFKNACIVLTDMTISDEGEVFAKFNLIDTPVGRIVKAFQDAGVQFGISIRGAGDVAGDGEVDPDSFVFRGFDLVAFPAYNDCMPTFQAIAASSDLESKKRYKKVCSELSKGILSITASSTLDIIQEQFRTDSDEYAMIQSRIDQLEAEANAEKVEDVKLEDTTIVVNTEDTVANDECIEILEQKLDGVTSLYIDELVKNSRLESEICQLKKKCETDLSQMEVECSRKIERAKRIMASQLSGLTTQLDDMSKSYKVSVAANTKLKNSLSDIQASTDTKIQAANDNIATLKSDNLKYRQKVESTTALLQQRDNEIERIKSELSETVTASKMSSHHLSDLDKKIQELEAKVTAADDIILSYQQAYANMYANALGVRIDNLPITASTSVESLQKLIKCNSNVSNVSTVFVEPQPVDVVVSEEYDEDSLVTM